MTNKPKNEREEFIKKFGLIISFDDDNATVEENEATTYFWRNAIWHWHIESQKRLLERVRDYFNDYENHHFGVEENSPNEVYLDDLNDYIHSLLKELEKEGE